MKPCAAGLPWPARIALVQDTPATTHHPEMGSDWVDVGSAADLARDGRVVARVNGREVGVVAEPDGTLHGIRNRCPHHGGPLCLGRVGERVVGDPGVYRLTGRRTLRCPWHGWEFDLETGACLDEATLRAAVYPARIEDGRVLLQA